MTGWHPKRECPTCGRWTAVRIDGGLHKHGCVAGVGTTATWAHAVARRQYVIDTYMAAPTDAKPTLAELGRAVGVTRERVRQYLAEIGVVPRQVNRAAKQARQAAALRAKFVASCEAALQRPPCVMCGAWVIRSLSHPAAVTCSEDCSDRYGTAARYVVSAEQHARHRVTQARSILRHASNQKPSRVAWAKRMLGPNPPPPNRRFAVVNKELFDRTHNQEVAR